MALARLSTKRSGPKSAKALEKEYMARRAIQTRSGQARGYNPNRDARGRFAPGPHKAKGTPQHAAAVVGAFARARKLAMAKGAVKAAATPAVKAQESVRAKIEQARRVKDPFYIKKLAEATPENVAKIARRKGKKEGEPEKMATAVTAARRKAQAKVVQSQAEQKAKQEAAAKAAAAKAKSTPQDAYRAEHVAGLEKHQKAFAEKSAKWSEHKKKMGEIEEKARPLYHRHLEKGDLTDAEKAQLKKHEKDYEHHATEAKRLDQENDLHAKLIRQHKTAIEEFDRKRAARPKVKPRKSALEKAKEKAAASLASKSETSFAELSAVTQKKSATRNVHFSPNVDDAFKTEINKAIYKMPKSVVGHLEKAGYRIYAVHSMTEGNPELANKRPRGYPEGATWSHVDGIHVSSKKEIIVAQMKAELGSNATVRTNRATSVLFHETGHALDAALGAVSTKREFREAYQKDVQAIPEGVRKRLGYYLQKGDVGPREAFAETFAQHHGKLTAANHILDYFPNTYNYVKGLLG